MSQQHRSCGPTSLPTPERPRWRGAVAALLLALVSACGGGKGADPPTSGSPSNPSPVPLVSQITVDTSVRPTTPGTSARPVAAVTGDGGAATDIVIDELLVLTDDSAALAQLLARHNGSTVSTVRFAELGLTGMPALHHIRLAQLDNVDPASLPRDLERLSPGRHDHLRVGDEKLVRLMALAARETRPGFEVMLNTLIEPQGLADGTSTEAASAKALTPDERSSYGQDYQRDAFTWPYMKQGGPLDIGVTEAWRYLEAADRLRPSVRLLIVDGGFKRNDDLPSGTTMLSAWDVPNPDSCGNRPCPWHGTAVASAAAARVDNLVGTAGSGGPVVKLYLGQIWGEVNDVGDAFKRIFETLNSLITISGTLASPEPLIVSLSGSTRVSTLLDPLVSTVWGALASRLRAEGVMVIAAAGNDGDDVDRESCFGPLCWEPTVTIPCELPQVLCVGGVRTKEPYRHTRSNFGTKDSVKLFGPYEVWTVDEDAIDGQFSRQAKLSSGTSLSAPFVAGIAALVRAADPGLSPNAVERVLLETANASPDGEVRRIVNAAAAVRRVLGPRPPRITHWPQQGLVRALNEPLWLTLNAARGLAGDETNVHAIAITPGPLSMKMVSNNTLDEATPEGHLRFGSVGRRSITLTVTDAAGLSDARSFDVDVRLADGRLFAALGADGMLMDQVLRASARGFERTKFDPMAPFADVPCHRIVWTVPYFTLGIVPVGSLNTELGSGFSVRGCDAAFTPGVLAVTGTYRLHVKLLGADDTTPIAERSLTFGIDFPAGVAGPEVGALVVTDSSHQLIDPLNLRFFATGIMVSAMHATVAYADPGDQGIQVLQYSVESFVTRQRIELPLDGIDRDFADSAVLPVIDGTAPAWGLGWMLPFPEPSMAVLRLAVTDHGITASRPFLIRLLPYTPLK